MKVELKVQDLLQKAANDKFYIALLRERDGNRSLPILVGLLEAQAIAMFLRDVSTERPMLHDLIAGMADAFAIRILEVYIYMVKGGVFYSYLVCEQYGQTVNVDARTSDAIAIALHQGRPIYIEEELLNAQCMRDEGGGACHCHCYARTLERPSFARYILGGCSLGSCLRRVRQVS